MSGANGENRERNNKNKNNITEDVNDGDEVAGR